MNEKTLSNSQMYGLMLAMLLSGAGGTIARKAQDELTVNPKGEKFMHPYYQAMLLSLG